MNLTTEPRTEAFDNERSSMLIVQDPRHEPSKDRPRHLLLAVLLALAMLLCAIDGLAAWSVGGMIAGMVFGLWW